MSQNRVALITGLGPGLGAARTPIATIWRKTGASLNISPRNGAMKTQ